VEVFFLDDSAQKGARPGMGTVVAAGGVFVESASLRPLSAAIDAACAEAGVPVTEEVKWSPKKGSWIHEKLHGDARQNCYSSILKAAAEHKVRAAVVCWDTGRDKPEGAGRVCASRGLPV
jgi:hypothetical protein